ncbi:MAG: protease inhibitor I42 family protein [Legionellaceae bacterium]
MLKSVVSLILMLGSLMLYAKDPMVLSVPASTATFEVRLPANPTTGFQWHVKQYDKAHFDLLKRQYKSPTNGLIGAGGEMFFLFKVKAGVAAPRSTRMIFCYSRSFEPNSGKLQYVQVTFKPSLKKH